MVTLKKVPCCSAKRTAMKVNAFTKAKAKADKATKNKHTHMKKATAKKAPAKKAPAKKATACAVCGKAKKELDALKAKK